MTLAELPKKLKKREANWTTTVFRKWCEEKYRKPAVFEIKYAKGNSLPFSDVEPHQIANLLAVRHGTFVYKIADMGQRNPFDMFCMTEMPAFIVIKYPKGFVLIAVDTFLLESKKSKRRSLTWERACEIKTL